MATPPPHASAAKAHLHLSTLGPTAESVPPWYITTDLSILFPVSDHPIKPNVGDLPRATTSQPGQKYRYSSYKLSRPIHNHTFITNFHSDLSGTMLLACHLQ